MILLCIECRISKGIAEAPHDLLDWGICPNCGKFRLMYEVEDEGYAPKDIREVSAPTFGTPEVKKHRKRAK